MPYAPTTTPLSASNLVTAGMVAPIPVPTHGPGGHFAVLAKTHLPNTAPIKVLSLIRDTTTWPKWNSFCASSSISPKSPAPPASYSHADIPAGREGWLELGTVAIVDVFMSGDGLVPGAKKSRDQGIVISRIEQLDDGREGFRIAWTSTGFSHWQLHSERVMDFVDDGKGGTEYACWETFGGLLATVVKATYGGTLVERFGDYAGDVRGWFEKGEKWKEAPGEGVENGADANGKVLENVTLT